MAHELGRPVGELRDDARERFGGGAVGVEAVDEVIRRPHAGRAQAAARALARRPNGNGSPFRRGGDDRPDRRVKRRVVVGVEVRRGLARHALEESRSAPRAPRRSRLPGGRREAPRGCRRNDPFGARLGTSLGGDAGRPPPVRTKWRPRDSSGARSAACRIARAAAFSRTMTVAEVTIPRACASKMPSLIPGERPKSSALTMSCLKLTAFSTRIGCPRNSAPS